MTKPVLLFFLGLLLLPSLAHTQTAPSELSLREAVALAREHNPEYRTRLGQ